LLNPLHSVVIVILNPIFDRCHTWLAAWEYHDPVSRSYIAYNCLPLGSRYGALIKKSQALDCNILWATYTYVSELFIPSKTQVSIFFLTPSSEVMLTFITTLCYENMLKTTLVIIPPICEIIHLFFYKLLFYT
jgi:hypothetical protein